MVLIYAFTCTENGKAYIGCTAGKFAKRFREHKCNLNAGTHTERLLLADWNLYGSDKFVMEVVYELEDDVSTHTKRGMEKFAMQRYKSAGLLYNTNESCFEPARHANGRKFQKGAPHPVATHSPEANEKRRLAQLGIPKGHGHKISATKRARNAMR